MSRVPRNECVAGRLPVRALAEGGVEGVDGGWDEHRRQHGHEVQADGNHGLEHGSPTFLRVADSWDMLWHLTVRTGRIEASRSSQKLPTRSMCSDVVNRPS